MNLYKDLKDEKVRIDDIALRDYSNVTPSPSILFTKDDDYIYAMIPFENEQEFNKFIKEWEAKRYLLEVN